VIRLGEKPDCENCKEIYKWQGSDPPCEDCLPLLTDENRLAISVYTMVSTQVISVGMAAVVDLNHAAVTAEINRQLPEIPRYLKDRIFSRIIYVFRIVLDERRVAAEAEKKSTHHSDKSATVYGRSKFIAAGGEE